MASIKFDIVHLVKISGCPTESRKQMVKQINNPFVALLQKVFTIFDCAVPTPLTPTMRYNVN